jgi:hypothetical protein
MSSEARKHTGETLLDQMQALGRGYIETEMADLITPSNVLRRSGAVIPAASALGEDLGYLTHHRIFACLPEIAGYRKSHRRRREPARRSR